MCPSCSLGLSVYGSSAPPAVVSWECLVLCALRSALSPALQEHVPVSARFTWMFWIAGSEVEGEVRVQNADGTVEVQADEEPWDGSSSATSSSDVSAPLLRASLTLSQVFDRAVWCTLLLVVAYIRLYEWLGRQSQTSCTQFNALLHYTAVES